METDGMYWLRLLKKINASWVLAIIDGRSLLEEVDVPEYGRTTFIEFMLDNEIVPIVRDGTDLLPRSFTNAATVQEAAEIYARYGIKPVWQCRNEPFDPRSYIPGYKVPRPNEEGMEFVCNIIMNDMRQVADAGGIAGFPDGPTYPLSPFDYMDGVSDLWYNGLAHYTMHNYGKNRPRNFPYDDVNRYGVQLTMEEYRRQCDDMLYYRLDSNGHNDWYGGQAQLDRINAQRRAWANPEANVIDDDTCFLGWLKVAYWSKIKYGFVVPMSMTEGGWEPKDMAGSGGASTDIRYVPTTCKEVGKKTHGIYQDQMYGVPDEELESLGLVGLESPFYALCPWLLASADMGASGWPDSCWRGYAFEDVIDQDTGEPYGREKPVIHYLEENPPGPSPPIDIDAAIKSFENAEKSSEAACLAANSMLENLGE
jgi:hypothetical protein